MSQYIVVIDLPPSSVRSVVRSVVLGVGRIRDNYELLDLDSAKVYLEWYRKALPGHTYKILEVRELPPDTAGKVYKS